jgi:hypothetical protein
MVWVTDLHHALTDDVEAATRAIDRPPDRTFIGWCPGADDGCGAALYGIEGNAIARCPRCRATWDVEASRAALLASATDAVSTATTIARALGIPPPTLRSWHRRGRLGQATDPDGRPLYDEAGRPLYRVADVRRLAMGMQVEHAATTT